MDEQLTLDDLHDALEKAQQAAEDNLNGWKRAQADFENYQKRKENENKELIEFAREVAVAKLLPTLDTIEQALLHIPDPSTSLRSAQGILPEPVEANIAEYIKKHDEWKNGILGTLKQLDKVLAELGVKKIEAVGKKFDPNFHEAVREVPGEEDGLIVEEYQTGYELNGKVIRPSQVVISKKQ